MLFNSVDYLLFFPLVALIHWFIPKKYRYVWIVIASYYFYMCWDVAYAGILLFVTAATYLAANILSKAKGRGRWLTACVACVACFGVLVVYKYWDFMMANWNKVLRLFHGRESAVTLNLVLPVGISFYIFQAVGYVIDVYRGKESAERNFLRYAAFVSFFPNLLSGPIERAGNLLAQIRDGVSADLPRIKKGLLFLAWGLFLKVVVSNNMMPVISEVYDRYSAYGGVEIVIATVLFGIQIYCDFGGYSYMAIGSAGIMGYELRENFNAPYFSASPAEFWRKWHISLTSWFRDYLYIPLGGNRKGEWRKLVNTLIVFAVSGLWHGASWAFVFWGLLNGMYLVAGELAGKVFKGKKRILGKAGSFLFTFVLIDYAWMFFRADSLRQGIEMTKSIFLNPRWNYLFSGEVFRELGKIHLFLFFFVLTLVLGIVDYMKYRGVDVAERIFRLPALLRWGIYAGLLFAIIVFGIYGESYEQTQFIYFQF